MAVMLSILVMALFASAAEASDIKSPRRSNDGVVTWNLVTFGRYYAKDASTKEPIVWRVLEVNGTDAFLITEKAIDCRPYSTNHSDLHETWAKTAFRSWLNDEFLHEAFTDAEAEAIKVTHYSNASYSQGVITISNGGSPCDDKIFCLSRDDVMNEDYWFTESVYKNYNWYPVATSKLMAEATEYSIAKGCHVSDGTCSWWLRDVGSGMHRFLVTASGSLSTAVYSTPDVGVRPAMHVDMSLADLVPVGTVQDGVPAPTPTPSPTPSPTATPSPAPISGTHTAGNLVYSIKGSSATVIGPASKAAKTLTIPATVSILGQTCKVTAISNAAFKGMEKLKSVIIGKNVTTVGKQAFYNCSKLKTITIKTKKLKSVGSNAFKGIYKKASVKCPSGYKNKYKELLMANGMKKTVTFR